MKEDSNVGGEKLLKAKGEKARITASTSDQHFTLFAFTAGTGECVMISVIFNGQELTPENSLVLTFDIIEQPVMTSPCKETMDRTSGILGGHCASS